ncbi:MAG: hypothetical protein ACLFVJ_22895 [Persicimonas sp.]
MSESSPDKRSEVNARPSSWFASRAVPLVLLFLVTALAGAWTVDAVRALAVENLGPAGLVDLEAALSDPEPQVALEACRHFLPRIDGEVSEQTRATLYARPRVASRCFEVLAARDESEMEPDELMRGSRWRMLAGQLSRGWLEESLAEGADQCTGIESAYRSMQASEAAAEYPMLRCALLSPSDTSRDCCVEQIGGEEGFEELLETPAEASIDQAREDFETFVDLWFADSPPTKTGDERHAQIQDWLVQIGCRMHLEQPGQRIIVSAFRPVIDGPSCAPDDEPSTNYYSSQSWEFVCTELYAQRRKQSAASPKAAICESLELASVADVVQTAGDEVDKALSVARPKARADAEAIEFGDVESGRGVLNRFERRRQMDPAAAEATRQIYDTIARDAY